MKKKRKANLPLIEVLVGSLILHLIVGVLIGSFVIYSMTRPPEAEFQPPPEIEMVEPQQLEYKVKMKQQQKQSARPRQQRVQVQTITEINIPQIDINLPAVDSKVAVGTGTGSGSGSGSGQGGGGLGFGKNAINFFGIRGAGEKLFFIVDASDYMLEDKKGGIPAYEIVKAEIANMVGKLPPGMLFNIAFYNGENVLMFKPELSPAHGNSKKEVEEFVAPINSGYGNRGVQANYQIQSEILPMTHHVRYWLRAQQAAMENGADTIFMLVSGWQWHGLFGLTEEQLQEWLKKNHNWNEKKEARWNNELVPQAEAWLKAENDKRRAAGQSEKVSVWIGDIVVEAGLGRYQDCKTHPAYSDDEVYQQVRNTVKLHYTDKKAQKPSINVVLFLGAGEVAERKKNKGTQDEDRFSRVIREGARGRFRVLEGMRELMNVTEKAVPPPEPAAN